MEREEERRSLLRSEGQGPTGSPSRVEVKRSGGDAAYGEADECASAVPFERIRTACVCLDDAQHNRDPRWNRKLEGLYRFRHSTRWLATAYAALVAYLAPCIFLEPRDTRNLWCASPWLALFHWAGLAVLLCDILLRIRYIGIGPSGRLLWLWAFVATLALGVVDTATRGRTSFAWSRAFAPTAVFYFYPKARQCAASSLRLIPIVLPIILLECITILFYSCLLVVLFHSEHDTTFRALDESFLRLYELSTTVNNPDVWLPLYEKYFWSSLLFISFLILNLFFVHNVLLATVWQGFIANMRQYTKLRDEWRDESIQRAFEALDTNSNGLISRDALMGLLERMRPHYNRTKREMLFEYVSGTGIGEEGSNFIGAVDFYDRILGAVNLRVHSYRNVATNSLIYEAFLIFLHVWNAAFSIWACIMSPGVFYEPHFWIPMLATALVSTSIPLSKIASQGLRTFWAESRWHRVEVLSGLLTIMGLLFLLVFTEFDEWSVLHFERKGPGDWRLQMCICMLMTSRIIDLGHLLRRFQSVNLAASLIVTVMPVVFAQFAVIMCVLHVYAYFGMWLWAGLVSPATDFGVEYYHMNNFNSYLHSLVTLFNLLMVNNWHIIAEGYAHVVTPSHWVYVYFVTFQMLAVAVAFNVLGAIFVNAFIAKSLRVQKAGVSAADIGGSSSLISAFSAYGKRPSVSNGRKSLSDGAHAPELPLKKDEGEKDTVTNCASRNKRGDDTLTTADDTPGISSAVAGQRKSSNSKMFDLLLSQKVNESRHQDIRKSSRGLAFALTRRQSTTEEDVYKEEDGTSVAQAMLFNAFAIGLGAYVGLRIETTQVKHDGLSLTTPRVLKQNNTFLDMLSPCINTLSEPGTPGKNVPSEISHMLNHTFHSSILNEIGEVEDLDMLELPLVVSTVVLDARDGSAQVQIQCIIVSQDNGVATILYTARPS